MLVNDSEIIAVLSLIRRLTYSQEIKSKLDKSESTLIPLDDKVLDVITGWLRDYNDDDFFLAKFSYSSDLLSTKEQPVLFLSCLRELLQKYYFVEDVIDYLQMALWLILVQSNKQPMGLVFYWLPWQGKSTIVETIINVIGKDLVTYMNLDDLKDQFRRIDLLGKALLYDDDASAKQSYKWPDLKKMLTGWIIDWRFLFKNVVRFYPYSKCVVCSNEKPNLKPTDGEFRRFSIVEIDRGNTDAKPWLHARLEEERELIFAWLLQGAVKFYQHFNQWRTLQSIMPIEIKLDKGSISEIELVRRFLNTYFKWVGKATNDTLDTKRFEVSKILKKYSSFPDTNIKRLLQNNGYKPYKSGWVRWYILTVP
jgi:phage/plasmid-associated DNA primase